MRPSGATRYLVAGIAVALCGVLLVPTAFGWRRIADDVGHNGLQVCKDGARAQVGNTPSQQLQVVASSPPWNGPPDPDTRIGTRDLTLKDVPVFLDDGGVIVELPYTGTFGMRWPQELTVGDQVGFEFLQPGQQPGTLDSVDAAQVEDCDLFAAPLPANDNFGAATVLSGPLVSVGGQQNANATKQVGEPDHAGDPGAHSLWYRWAAPVTGVARVNTCGANFDTLLAAYTGGSLTSLDTRAADDDGCGHLGGSRLRFPVQRSTTYRIAVDGFGGDIGTFPLALELSPGAATFGEPFDLSEAGRPALDPHVAIDADGDAVFVWKRSDGSNFRIQTRTRTAAGALSPVQTLSSGGQNASDPRVAVDPEGNAVFTWWRSDGTNFRVQARARSAAGVLSSVQNLSDPGQNAVDPEVAVDEDGDAVFTWPRFDGSHWRIQARTRTAAGVLGPVQDLSAAGQNAYDLGSRAPRPQVAVAPGGDAVFAWSRFDGAHFRAQTRELSGGSLTAVQTLTSSGQHVFDARVGVDADGDAVFVWTRMTDGTVLALTRTRSAAGVLSGAQKLSDPGAAAGEPQVAVDVDGDAVFTWRRFDGSVDRVQGRARSAAGVLSAVQNVSPAGQYAFSQQVGIDSAGNAVFTWQRIDHITPGGAVYAIQTRERSVAGSLFAVQMLSDSERSATVPDIAVAPDGEAATVWQRFDGANERIQAAMRP